MAENGKPETGLVNLPTPERGDSRGAASQDETPGAKNAGDEKSTRGDWGPTITPSEPDGGASEVDVGEDASKDKALAIEKRMEYLEAQISRLSQDATNARLSESREREKGLRLLEELAESQRQAGAGAAAPAPRGTVPGLSDPQQKAVADKETLPEKLDTFLGGDLTTMWINTTRSALPRPMRLVLDETFVNNSRAYPPKC